MSDLDQEAQKQVHAFLKELEAYYGLEPKDIHDLFEDVKWAASYRKKLATIGDWTTKSVVGMIVGAALLVVWEGIKHVAHR